MKEPNFSMRDPIFLRGICKDYIWGGDRLRTEFNKNSDAERIAESWELAAHPDGSSTLIFGNDAGMGLQQYIEKYGTEFLGTACAGAKTLPVLIKLIDAKMDLSIQVHPDDEYAMRVEGEPGKTEMWYIIDAKPGATLYYGLKRSISKEELAQRIREETLPEVLNQMKAVPGDVYFIPAGTLHAIGAGILLAEVQENSNTTYRVYDYGRKGADGKPRELHVDKALEVANLEPTPLTALNLPKRIRGGMIRLMAACSYFVSDLVTIRKTVNFIVTERSFHHLLMIKGVAILSTEAGRWMIKQGNSILLPAGMGPYLVSGDCQFILTAAGEEGEVPLTEDEIPPETDFEGDFDGDFDGDFGEDFDEDFDGDFGEDFDEDFDGDFGGDFDEDFEEE